MTKEELLEKISFVLGLKQTVSETEIETILNFLKTIKGVSKNESGTKKQTF
jgi:hypothetical protein